jgi:hypothetical protein
MGCGDNSTPDDEDAGDVIVVLGVFVALPVVVGVAAAGMAMFKVIGNDDNDVVVTKTAVVVIATVSTTRTAARQLFLVFLKYFISLPARRQRIKELLFIQ